MKVLSPAKINLDLRVGPPRADGFHPLWSWMVTVGLYDVLTFAPADELSLDCGEHQELNGPRNLVWRAAEALRFSGVGHPRRGVSIRLDKSIPAGGGLGGGSSNAAATLIALDQFWNIGHSMDQLHGIAETLGSDVPFFLHGPSALCEGRGERVTSVPPPVCRWAVLCLPGIAMPTPAVYRRLDERGVFSPIPLPGETPMAIDPLPQPQGQDDPLLAAPAAWGGQEASLRLLPLLVNDLEPAAFDLSPALGRLRSSLEADFCRPVRMSGSGSTLFTLFDDRAAAEAAAERARGWFRIDAVAVEIAPTPNPPAV